MEADAESHADSVRVVPGKTTATRRKHGRSAISNGSVALPDMDGRSASARRYKDILAAIVGDLGGADMLSESQRQLARRAASLSCACEQLEARIIGGHTTPDFRQTTSGYSPHQILEECGKLLHSVARIRGGDGPRQMAKLEPPELARISDLLVRAGDLAAKAIASGDQRTKDCEALGTLSARLVRVLSLLGLRRQAREIGAVTLADLLKEDQATNQMIDAGSGHQAAAHAIDGEVATDLPGDGEDAPVSATHAASGLAEDDGDEAHDE
jgi:hypothetical protein